MHRRRVRTLRALIGVGVMALALADTRGLAGALAGTVLVLYLGWVAVDAALPIRDQPTGTSRWALRAGIGGCLVVLVGLILASMSDVTRTGWVVSLGTTDVVLTIVGSAREAALFRNYRRSATGAPVEPPAEPAVGRVHIALIALAIAIGAAAVAISVASANSVRPQTFTELSIADVSTSATPHTVTIDVRSSERTEHHYTVVASAAGEPLGQWSVALRPNQQWTQVVTAAPGAATARVDLYIENDPSIYRWVSVAFKTQGSPSGTAAR